MPEPPLGLLNTGKQKKTHRVLLIVNLRGLVGMKHKRARLMTDPLIIHITVRSVIWSGIWRSRKILRNSVLKSTKTPIKGQLTWEVAT